MCRWDTYCSTYEVNNIGWGMRGNIFLPPLPTVINGIGLKTHINTENYGLRFEHRWVMLYSKQKETHSNNNVKHSRWLANRKSTDTNVINYVNYNYTGHLIFTVQLFLYFTTLYFKTTIECKTAWIGPKGQFLDLYFKTCNIRLHFLGPMGGLKIEGPLYTCYKI